MEMNEKGTEPHRTEILSREELLAAGCPEETVHKILRETDSRCQCRCLRQCRKEILERLHGEQERLTNVDYLLYHLEKR